MLGTVVHNFSSSWQKFLSSRMVINKRRRRSPLAGSGGMPARKFLHFKSPETEFPWFWAQFSNNVSSKSNRNFSILLVLTHAVSGFLHVIPKTDRSELIIVYLCANQIIFKPINCNGK